MGRKPIVLAVMGAYPMPRSRYWWRRTFAMER
jgi:hypothetical protein